MRQAAQRDKNEAEIVDALRQAGYLVTLLNDPAVPDLLVIKSGPQVPIKVCRNAEAALAFADEHKLCLVEVKGKTGTLTPAQKIWWQNATGIKTL